MENNEAKGPVPPVPMDLESIQGNTDEVFEALRKLFKASPGIAVMVGDLVSRMRSARETNSLMVIGPTEAELLCPIASVTLALILQTEIKEEEDAKEGP